MEILNRNILLLTGILIVSNPMAVSAQETIPWLNGYTS